MADPQSVEAPASSFQTYPLGVGALITRVIEVGDPEAPAVVFLHGMGARADRWLLNLGPVALAGFRAVALDFPGHGFATKGAAPDYSVEGYSRFVRDALDALGISSAVLVGTSLGGHVALALACENPGLVNGLVLVGSLGIFPVGDDLAERMAGSLRSQTPDAVRGKLNFVLGDHSIITDSWIHEESMVNSSPGAAEGFALLADYVTAQIDEELFGDRLVELSHPMPVQLVWGSIDQSVPAEIGRRAASTYGWPLALLDGAGHLPYRERAEQFNEVLLGSLRRSA